MTSDVGLVAWEGDDLVERGTFPIGGRDVPYVEVWRRLPHSEAPIVALASDDGWGRLVRAGDHAITVIDERPLGGDFRACYRTRSPSGWRVELALGPGAAELPVPRPDVLGIPARMPGWHQVSAPPEPEPAPPRGVSTALPLLPGPPPSFPGLWPARGQASAARAGCGGRRRWGPRAPGPAARPGTRASPAPPGPARRPPRPRR